MQNKYTMYIKENYNEQTGLSAYFNEEKFGGTVVERGVKHLPNRKTIYAKYDKEILSFTAYGIGPEYTIEFMQKIDPQFITIKRSDLYNHIRYCCVYFSQKEGGLKELKDLIGDYKSFVENFIDNNISIKTEYKTIIDYHINQLINCCNNSPFITEAALDYSELNNLKKDCLRNIQQAASKGDINALNIYTNKLNNLEKTIQQLEDPNNQALITLIKQVLPSLQNYKTIITN